MCLRLHTDTPEKLALTDDAFLGGALHILQPLKGYRAGIDAVLLAASLNLGEHKKARVLDVGSGVGVAGLCIATRCTEASVTLLEKQSVLSGLAHKNVVRNKFESRVHIANCDVLAPVSTAKVRQHMFDHVISNPPYYDDNKIRNSANSLKAQSNAMPQDALQHWIKFMAQATKPGGSATIVHLAERLPDILKYFTMYFGEICVQPLHPRLNKKASRILLRGIRDSKAPMQISPGVTLHNSKDSFCPEIERVLRNPVIWPIW